MPILSWKKSPALMKYLKNDFLQNLVYRQEEVDKTLIAYVEEEIAVRKKQLDEDKDPLSVKSRFTIQALKDLMIKSIKN